LYVGNIIWHEIAEPLFSKKTTKSNEDMNYDKFESEHKRLEDPDRKSKLSQDKNKKAFPREDDPADRLEDLEEAQRGFRKGDRGQVDSTKKSEQQLPKRPKPKPEGPECQ